MHKWYTVFVMLLRWPSSPYALTAGTALRPGRPDTPFYLFTPGAISLRSISLKPGKSRPQFSRRVAQSRSVTLRILVAKKRAAESCASRTTLRYQSFCPSSKPKQAFRSDDSRPTLKRAVMRLPADAEIIVWGFAYTAQYVRYAAPARFRGLRQCAFCHQIQT